MIVSRASGLRSSSCWARSSSDQSGRTIIAPYRPWHIPPSNFTADHLPSGRCIQYPVNVVYFHLLTYLPTNLLRQYMDGCMETMIRIIPDRWCCTCLLMSDGKIYVP